jgi:hypothetical protein
MPIEKSTKIGLGVLEIRGLLWVLGFVIFCPGLAFEER